MSPRPALPAFMRPAAQQTGQCCRHGDLSISAVNSVLAQPKQAGLTSPPRGHTNTSADCCARRFVTRQQIGSLGLGHLVGTPLLRAYMHGYFMHQRLWQRAQSLAPSDTAAAQRAATVAAQLDAQRASRITLRKRLPKVRHHLTLLQVQSCPHTASGLQPLSLPPGCTACLRFPRRKRPPKMRICPVWGVQSSAVPGPQRLQTSWTKHWCPSPTFLAVLCSCAERCSSCYNIPSQACMLYPQTPSLTGWCAGEPQDGRACNGRGCQAPEGICRRQSSPQPAGGPALWAPVRGPRLCH